MSFFSEYSTAQKIIQAHHPIIVYAENRHYYQYFQKLIEDLLNNTSLPILYITSDKKDKLLFSTENRLQVVYIKTFLGFLFSRLKADVMVLTMPDLDNYLYKRSKLVGSYIYIFHAAVSTHQQYKKKAFFYYDTVFCTGPYQVEEIKATEKKYGLREKEIIPYGYPLLDVIKTRFSSERSTSRDIKKILVAPSWFESCIFETCIEPLIEQLATLPYEVLLRSHPEYIKRHPKKYSGLKRRVDSLPSISFDESTDVINSLVDADILITDRSGIALEYCFGTHRPVLFVDTPPKVINHDWKELNIEPLENSIRSKVGISISPIDLSSIADKIRLLVNEKEKYFFDLQMLEKELFYNSEESYKKGVKALLEKTHVTKY